MVRRSIHTPEQLRELVIKSAHEIVTKGGLSRLSAREIARRIGYSPGALYNVFDSLDELLLEVEARVLDALEQRLSRLQEQSPEVNRLSLMAREYGKFCREHPRLWNLIAQHDLASTSTIPLWYAERIERLLRRIELALVPHFPPSQNNSENLRQSARVVWAGLYGITSLSTSGKLSRSGNDFNETLVDDFIDTYLAGLTAQRKGH